MDKKIVSGRAPVLNCAHECFQDPSGALQRSPGEFPETFSSVFLHILARFYANLCSRTHVVCNLSQALSATCLQPPGELPKAFSGFFLHIFPRFYANLCTPTHFMRTLSQKPTRIAHSRKNLQSLPRFNANLCTLTHFMRNLSQQPTRSAHSRTNSAIPLGNLFSVIPF